AQHREDEVAGELLAQVVDVDAAGAGRGRPLADGVELLALAEVGAEGDDLAAVLLDQPAQNDRRVEPAAVGEHHLVERGSARRLRALPAPPAHRALPFASHAMSAFCRWRRFSAWSKTTDCGPSSTLSVISSPRCAGRQCITSAPRAAWRMTPSFTW